MATGGGKVASLPGFRESYWTLQLGLEGSRGVWRCPVRVSPGRDPGCVCGVALGKMGRGGGTASRRIGLHALHPSLNT